MFNFTRVLGLAILSSAAALSGCGGDDANKDRLLTCSDGDFINAQGVCEARPPACPSGQVRNPESGECEALGFAGPTPVFSPAENQAVIYYNRQHVDADYSTTKIYRWNGCPGADVDWSGDLAGFPGPEEIRAPDGIDPVYGAYYTYDIEADAACGNYIISIGGNANQSADLAVRFDVEGSAFNRMSFFIASNTGSNSAGRVSSPGTPICLEPEEGSSDVCSVPPMPTRPIRNFAAHWIDTDTLVWEGVSAETTDAVLYSSSTGGITQDANGTIIAGPGGDLNKVGDMAVSALTEEQAAKYPLLAGDNYTAFLISGVTPDSVKEALKGQLLVAATDGTDLVGTLVQSAKVLDALYTAGDNDADEANLGINYTDGGITASVWAPTAVNVRIKLFSAAAPDGSRTLNSIEAMTLNSDTGVWTYSGPQSLDGTFYVYEVSVYDSSQDEMTIFDSTDPYSVSLSTDSLFSQFIDLTSDALKPEGWEGHTVPTIDSPEMATIYEGHIRDFSIRDESTSAANRGKYLAFTEDSAPVRHLQELQSNGLTHFHLLPTFDISSVVEDSEFQVNLTDPISELCALTIASDIKSICDNANGGDSIQSVLESFDTASTMAQDLTNVLHQVDGFNWGYDPYHFNAPEGSYSSDPEGPTRILEMRTMVKALHDMGLRVVMDVVYNHTTASGADIKSTFDKIVPGYYYRRDPITGDIEGATCCEDTASENRMMAKFMKDSLVQWAEQYAIDAFRFDLMGYHPKALIEESLAAVQIVDEDTYFYGEGWETAASSAGGARFEQATQLELGGTGVGTFNDRMRDPLRSAAIVNGRNVDRVRVGLAGNLSTYKYYNSNGVFGADSGSYTLDPQENVAYVSKHDEEALWDWLHMEGALPEDLSMANRARVQAMTLSVPLLSQGVSFIHMGADLLRSKSMDSNSYNSGDWFNYVDFTQTDNNWNVGIPPGGSAPEADSFQARILANAEADPNAATIAWASDVFNNFLALSNASPLFNLTTGEQVSARLGFHNTGQEQTEGLIVMSIDDGDTPASLFAENEDVELEADVDLEDLDPNYDAIVVIINGNLDAVSHEVATATGFTLSSIQSTGVDDVVKGASFDDATSTFTVPGLTTAVFVKAQAGDQGYGLYAGASPTPGGPVPNPYGLGTNFYLRGVNGDWSASNQMVYDLAGNFTAFAELDAGSSQSFKVATADWSTQFTTAAAVSSGVDTVMINGEGQDNAAFTSGEAGEYRFNVNTLDPAAPVLNVAPAESYAATPIYARGFYGDWGTSRELAYQGESVYSGVFTLSAGNTAFKVADEDWGGGEAATGFNFGVPDDVPRYVAGVGALTLNNVGGENGDIEVNIPADGDYLIRLDARAPLQPILSIVLAEPFAGTPLFVRGINADWGTTNELQFQGNAVYSVNIDVTEASSEKFKIADEGWTDGTNFGTDSPVNFGESVIFVNGGGDAFFSYNTPDETADEDGTYSFTLDASKGRLEVTVKPVPMAP